MHGSWIWRELLTRDPERSIAFYTQLFGWTTQAVDERIELCHQDRSFAHVVPTDTGDPANQWVLCASVHDLPGAREAVVSLGGQVVATPASVASPGRCAHVLDPNGARMGLMQHDLQPAADGTGGPVWQELHSPAVSDASQFYSGLLGWRFGKIPLPSGTDYHMATGAHGDAAGVLSARDTSQPAVWLQYFSVASADVAARDVGGLGGAIALDPVEIPGVGRMALLVDSVGAVFAVLS